MVNYLYFNEEKQGKIFKKIIKIIKQDFINLIIPIHQIYFVEPKVIISEVFLNIIFKKIITKFVTFIVINFKIFKKTVSNSNKKDDINFIKNNNQPKPIFTLICK